ncbi:MAG TPA: hypothetical protein VEH50_06090 [Methylomirabilota bacterium]|nr:hypothetical protein [Methylomirabilota bacterium]
MADLKNTPIVGTAFNWLGLAPDDSPLVLRDTGIKKIYSLHIDLP